ncbi:Zn-dependent protease (includes SpoIVFB) [Thermomonospora echinospora]|uniref:Zinc metalloprotease n=1 Tax=Thermomonospora echinospora TaxID=1992 RepID=A0A1H6CVM9_9ACTN|nr:site-2 protease family protein [Thermomonospora echinospora]SEG77139.1 Zn-dependent protease (includes SpoIVFB) [Thermomonospora echinospora]
MNESIRLGRIAGIRVGLNLSVLVIVAIVVIGLAFGQLPAAFRGYSPAEYVLAGVLAAVAFLASLLAHELAHAIVARRNGLEVEGITLWLLGGVARLRGEPRSPGADFRIAFIGPLTSVLLGLVFALLAELVARATGSRLATGVLAYLALVNLVLAVFNLIPAAPLDGGRVLRAALWRWWGDRHRAAISATRAGRVFGFVLIVLGAVQIFAGFGFNGLWLALIGWFLVSAASAEEQQTAVQSALGGVRVADVMTPQPVAAHPDDTVAGFIDRVVLSHRFSTYPLLDEAGRLSGLVTLNRIRAVPAERRADTTLREIACPPQEVPRGRPEQPIIELMAEMTGCTDGRAVVVTPDERVIGLVTPSDISRTLQLGELAGGPGLHRGADTVTLPQRRH